MSAERSWEDVLEDVATILVQMANFPEMLKEELEPAEYQALHDLIQKQAQAIAEAGDDAEAFCQAAQALLEGIHGQPAVLGLFLPGHSAEAHRKLTMPCGKAGDKTSAHYRDPIVNSITTVQEHMQEHQRRPGGE
jgi:hypothetical protein